MKLTPLQTQKLAEKVLAIWKAHSCVEFKADEKDVLKRAIEAVNKEYRRETDLDVEVNQMLDKLEESNPGEFQRYKMFSLLKQKLAKEKKVIL